MSKKQETIEIAVYLHHDPDRAVLVSDDGEKKHAQWLPKSQIELNASESDDPDEFVATIPEWLAMKVGFI